mgnify:CR=1 FL=1
MFYGRAQTGCYTTDMAQLFLKKRWYIGVALLLIGAALALMAGVATHDREPPITATVEAGAVRQLVSVSGVAEAADLAELAFPVGGIVASAPVREGASVTAGDVLLTLDTTALQADRADALAALASARADRAELLAGLRAEERDVVSQTVALKRAALEQTRKSQARTVENARRTLLSDGLTAKTDDPNEDAEPPTISGTYTCTDTGRYELDVYASNAQSGISFRLSGLEAGTFSGSIEQPTSFGSCGLRMMFDPDSNYSTTDWYIEVPNPDSAKYVTNQNAYELARANASSAIAVAEQELALAEATAVSDTAPARSEAIARANAAVARTQARLARLDAEIRDRTLRAPFDGVITTLGVLPGETVTTAPVVTLLADGRYELTARIPEIDVGQLEVGQTAEVIFDTRDEEKLTATVDFISPQATEIDGVAYYEAHLTLPVQPAWLRSGLNADVDIVVNEAQNALRLPKRFVVETRDGYEVRIQQGEQTASTTVEVLLIGNDGYVAITGLAAGVRVIAP